MTIQRPPKPEPSELEAANWFKATRSANGSDCVEVAHLTNWTAVRDSKNTDGPVHLFTTGEWGAFLDGVRKGEFDRS